MTGMAPDAPRAKTCRNCAKPIYRRNKSGVCRACAPHDAELIRRRTDGWRRAYTLRPELLEACTKRLVDATKTPEHSERARKMMTERRLWERGIEVAGPAGSPIRQKGGRNLSRTRLGHIPPRYRDEYRRLVNRKGFKAAEAAQLIAEQHAADLERWRKTIATPSKDQRAEALADLPIPPDPLEAVCEVFCVDKDDLLGKRRFPTLVNARAVAVKVLRDQGASFPEIGRAMNRDHSSILHLYETFERRATDEPFLRDAAKRIAEIAA